jgi:hypothetical protein
MIRMMGSALVSRASTVAIDLVVCALIVLALIELVWDFVARPSHTEATSIIAGVSVVMIGWGVALEERGEVRSLFGAKVGRDEFWQEQVDEACKGVGVMLLLAGLFAEIWETLITLPKSLFSTHSIRDVLLILATLCLVGGLVILAVHVIQLVTLRRKA